MQFKLSKPLAFTEIGRKDNNEDRISPSPEHLTPNTRCFVLCDGMGGHERGEVAAEIVVSTLRPSLIENRTDPDIITPQRWGFALSKAYDELDKMQYSSVKRPGTTMTCVYMAANGVLVAHIGDSRVYQIRPRTGIVFQTSDHSLVNELVKIGELTEEEAKNFPRRNVITRAMQPGLETRYKADTKILTDVQGGDYFFMCSDGVLENIDNKLLVDIINSGKTDEEKIAAIHAACKDRTRDNYTCILIPVAEVSGEPLATPGLKDIQAAPIPRTAGASGDAPRTQRPQPATESTGASANAIRQAPPRTNAAHPDATTQKPMGRYVPTKKKKSPIAKYVGITAALLLVAGGIIWFVDYTQDNPDEAPVTGIEQEQEFENEENEILHPHGEGHQHETSDEGNGQTTGTNEGKADKLVPPTTPDYIRKPGIDVPAAAQEAKNGAKAQPKGEQKGAGASAATGNPENPSKPKETDPKKKNEKEGDPKDEVNKDEKKGVQQDPPTKNEETHTES